MQRSLPQDEAAVSEVVGALLLVLIVSTAAFSFGVFYSQQQKRTQEQEAYEEDRRLERVQVLSVAPDDSDADGDWDGLDVDLASLTSKKVNVTGVRINGQLQTAGCTPSCSFPIEARHQVQTSFMPSTPIPATDEIKVEVLTERGNHFTNAFVPPSAVILLDQQGSGDETIYTLDGGDSQVGGQAGFLVRYAWEIYTSTCSSGATPLAGKRVQYDPPPGGGTYCIRLTVTDNVGLTGKRELTFDLS